ncbi:DUF308 domain-containing protein [Kitasatospora indigofera]|uniref:DUF308 domain-containing protein n=1 Tax=Kitasatospora indigofera TaxID=67307 RepID=UPI0036AEBA22
MNEITVAAAPGQGRSDQFSLLKLSLGRGVLAVAWAAAFAGAHHTLDATAVTLLIVYPLIDAVSSFIDLRSVSGESGRRVIEFNAVVSVLAAIGVGLAGASGAEAVLHVFGVWAVVSGAAQAVVGLRRRGPGLGKQWPMLIAGGLSFLVGVFYNVQALGDAPELDALATYAAAGGGFFLVQAGLLARRARRIRAARAARSA